MEHSIIIWGNQNHCENCGATWDQNDRDVNSVCKPAKNKTIPTSMIKSILKGNKGA